MASRKVTVSEKVPIAPGVSMLAVLSRLNYKPWYAIAEFVDNSIQSFLDNQAKLKKLHGTKTKLKVTIKYDSRDGGTLRILDNAGGISEREFKRAFRPAEVPADTSGLHEYGMGMKSAACWFSPNWVVRTSELGKPTQKTIHFDIKKIVEDKIEELDVTAEPAQADLHFTEIILRDLHRPLHTNTVAKIKRHLASIYRHFLEDEVLDIDFEGPLTYQSPPILKAPFFKDPKGNPRTWKSTFSINLGKGRKAEGFAAIRETASTSEAGFALFRKRRLIQGSLDETWRPEQIFGASTKYRYQRVFGEVHLSGFDVSHTKDGFVWEELEDTLIEKLKTELGKHSINILTQAEGYRARVTSEDIEAPVTRTLQKLGPAFSKDLGKVIAKSGSKIKAFSEKSPPKALRSKPDAKSKRIQKSFDLKFRDEHWSIELVFDRIPTSEDLIDIGDSGANKKSNRKLTVRLNTDHPFYQNFVNTDSKATEVVTRLAVAVAVAETLARDGGLSKAGLIRTLANEVLRKVLSR